MNFYILTHGSNYQGPDPGLDAAGVRKVGSIRLPSGIPQIICGTGRRFLITLNCLTTTSNYPVAYSTLCGSAVNIDETVKGHRVNLDTGTVVRLEDYILIGSTGMDIGAWVRSFPENTLFIAGREFLEALGYEEGELGCLYRYDGATVTLME